MKELSLSSKLNQSDKNFVINGLNPNQWSILFKDFFLPSEKLSFKQNLFVFPDEDSAEAFYNSIKSRTKTLYYPDLGSDIYSSIVPSEFNLVKRFSILNKLANLNQKEEISVITTISGLNLLCPKKEFFQQDNLKIEVSDIYEPAKLAEILINNGHKRTPTTEEPGTFAIKGEIFDIYPIGSRPIRLHFFDDMIEEIFEIDPDTLITKRDSPLESFTISNTQFSLLNKVFLNNFRNNLPRPQLSQKEKVHYRETIFKKLNKGEFFDDYPLFLSYFFEENSTLREFVDNFNVQIFNKFESIEVYEGLKSQLSSDYESFEKYSEDVIKPEPERVYDYTLALPEKHLTINHIDISFSIEEDSSNLINIKTTSIQNCIQKFLLKEGMENRLIAICQMIKEKVQFENQVYIYTTNENSKKEIEYLLNVHINNSVIISRIIFVREFLEAGFLYDFEKILFLSDSDFFQKKVNKAKTKNLNVDEDLFAEQLSTLKIDDHVIHKDFGIGKYKGIETLNLSGSTSDFIVLQYQDSDKVYVPVYKLNLLQKHSSNEAKVSLANLKTKKFEQAKAKAKGAVKKLAFDLLELQAKRKLRKGYAFSEPDHTFNEFSLSFKFKETPDQTKAIENVISDMVSDRPMDRLVCGDVGFGKTEVAMRAAFKAVLDNKQVGILVPTTVLAFQHYNSFVERFKGVPVQIEFISRFKTAKQVNEILIKLAEGKIDILIGTHKILSEKVKFKDIGLLVIDEEQRFGVAHKEKLKLFKETVDTLTLTATPIPRTLQMSFLGIKELSLIKTPPPRRQTIKTYIIKEDNHTLKLAIEKELGRGGQVFIVHNRVNDIEVYTAKIRALVQNARIIFAHGQMAEKELEKRITDFYNYKYDILISTTIIESGIDIPRANTMIIDRADTYGLSQLHQLRGRIGRSDRKAYAFFIVPGNKKISDVASKRLRALQTYADLGAGFSLATSDLEIRGSGDILGAEQSGHIGTIGLELYMDLLKECIQELKGEVVVQSKTIEIQTPFDAYIPKSFIENHGIRLKYYKRISNSNSIELLDEISYEIGDQFGKRPTEVENLINIIKSRVFFKNLALKSIRVKTSSIQLAFNQQTIENDKQLQEKVINFFMQRPKIYKINPDYSINCLFKDKITVNTLLEFAQYISEQLK
ncbi:MAG: transcription-repair coupling factor (superfamily II helicase) [Bacteriovoracaceae bacterium]|jgi:transcription-repair coupling factor (superfamily II helicase)